LGRPCSARARVSEALSCLALLVASQSDDWRIAGQIGEVEAVLRNALNARDEATRNAAVDLVHRLGARGFRNLGVLLP
jgi:hypothetical protein